MTATICQVLKVDSTYPGFDHSKDHHEDIL